MAGKAGQAPRPVRNDVSQPGEEVLVLRHQKLKKGEHETFYQISRAGVWPWFEKIGARVVGQWQIVYPDGEGEPEGYDEGYRLARYASFEHWQHTRPPANIGLGGDGLDNAANTKALKDRNEVLIGSDGPFFLQGHMGPDRPYYMPGLEEQYELMDGSETDVQPARSNVEQPGQEVVTLRYWKVKKGSFDEFYQASLEGVWPYFQKVGARIVGQWKVIYPPPRACDRKESSDFDEVLMMTRYASYEHWQATRQSAVLGGDGPDYDKLQEAIALRRSLQLETSVRFMQGYMYHSPPKYLPSLNERYRRN
jgi:hypothetical protein